MRCNVCQGTGFVNMHQFPESDLDEIEEKAVEYKSWTELALEWVEKNKEEYDVQVCNCCGDGEDWYGTPGEHYGRDDPQGENGPYAYNGGLCECH